ncbi:CRISPR system Cascade subunit CasA [Nitrosomonas eutropha]|uniref:type I-E CRISPR-associated protein Cse1/CasA n=1 Tax=Nitrosomonas eutropha TaxID=916 RepID=UPI00088C9C70|nr:type I-E CRISPR-associated protein Cse1/CasA [Nitrosomonas eutropha]SCX10046.1 CRISPR system Cascade subunit CasA [Nitrosomonas eutropha]
MTNMLENRFNLIDKPWLPVADVGRVSLKQIFSNSEYRALGGNPVQKIALMKLLLAIAQAACTPKDEQEWKALGARGLAQRCLAYLDKWHDRFWLYGEKPFLQMLAIAKANLQSYGAVQPEISTGNTTVLTQTQQERAPDDAERALLLVNLMSFALGGKKTDNSVVLSTGYAGKSNDKGKPSTGKPGPAVAHMGLLHNFLLGHDLWHSLWLNLFTHQQIAQINLFPQGCGIAPWEQMPEGEDCAIAKQLKQSLMGRLIPLSRFCLLVKDGLHYSEGLLHLSYKDGLTDPTTAIDYSGKDPKALWVNPEKRPWRELTALISFISQQRNQGFQCWQIQASLDRACDVTESFALWSGGLCVSSNAGEQYVSGSNDFVESQIWLHSSTLGALWFAQLQTEISALDTIAKTLYGCVMAYFKSQLVDGSKLAAQATNLFWQLCERDFQTLVDNCDQDEASQIRRRKLRLCFADYVHQAYNRLCSSETARQLDAWAKCRPNLSKYLKQED